MATFSGTITNNQIIIVVVVSVSGSDGAFASFNALLDTGAQVTMISDKVIQNLTLQSIGHMSIVPVTGAPHKTNKYRARIDIPIESQAMFGGGIVHCVN